MPAIEGMTESEWQPVLLATLAQRGLGIIVCDAEFRVVFHDHEAQRLIPGLIENEKMLGGRLSELVREQLVLGDTGEILWPADVLVHVAVRRLTSLVVLWVREQVTNDDALFLHLRQRYRISQRGFQLAQLVRTGLTNRTIGEQLRLSEATVKVYLHELYRDLGVRSRTELIALVDRVSRDA